MIHRQRKVALVVVVDGDLHVIVSLDVHVLEASVGSGEVRDARPPSSISLSLSRSIDRRGESHRILGLHPYEG